MWKPPINADEPSPPFGRNRGVYRFAGTSGEIVLRGTEKVIGKLGQRTEPVSRCGSVELWWVVPAGLSEAMSADCSDSILGAVNQ